MKNNNSNELYCIYSNSFFLKEDMNEDHIIPLSLGGHNDFIVDSKISFNSEFSSDVEGRLANDFLIGMNRNKLNLLGHSKKPILPYEVGNIENGKKVKIEFDKASKKVTVRDIRSNEEIPDWKKFSHSLNFKNLDFELFSRFAAKVALGSGYFLYKDLFVQNADCEELRLIMSGLSKLGDEEQRQIKTRGYFGRWFSSEEDRATKEYKIYSEICKSVQGSIVIIVPTTRSLLFHIGIASEYVGMINVPAKTDEFVKKYENNTGHVLMIAQGVFKQGSLKSLFKHLFELADNKTK
jgi:hypothetical protein